MSKLSGKVAVVTGAASTVNAFDSSINGGTDRFVYRLVKP
jgi:predicted methyltransferase